MKMKNALEEINSILDELEDESVIWKTGYWKSANWNGQKKKE